VVFHDADHFEVARLIPPDVYGHLTPERTLSREDGLGGGSGENDDGRGFRHVTRFEDSPFHERNLHRREVPGQHDTSVRPRCIVVCLRRSLGVPDGVVASRLQDRQPADDAHRLHSGQGFDALLEAPEELDALIAFLIVVGREGDRRGEKVLHAETGIDPAQPDEAPNEKPGSHQKDQ
jgi:hypothetical protein